MKMTYGWISHDCEIPVEHMDFFECKEPGEDSMKLKREPLVRGTTVWLALRIKNCNQFYPHVIGLYETEYQATKACELDHKEYIEYINVAEDTFSWLVKEKKLG